MFRIADFKKGCGLRGLPSFSAPRLPKIYELIREHGHVSKAVPILVLGPQRYAKHVLCFVDVLSTFFLCF